MGSKQGEKHWGKVRLEYTETKSVLESGRWLVRFTVTLVDSSFPNAFARRIVDESDCVPDVALPAYRGAWDDIKKRPERLGLSVVGSALEGTSVSNGKVDRMWARVIRASQTLQNFGKIQAKKRGRSTDEDSD